MTPSNEQVRAAREHIRKHGDPRTTDEADVKLLAALLAERDERIRAEEREACEAIAKLEWTMADDYLKENPEASDSAEAWGSRLAAEKIAASIRARAKEGK